MRVLVRHPVPVRWRPPRLDHDRHALLAVQTPIDLREASRGEMTAASARIRGEEIACAVFKGRAYRPMTQADLLKGGSPHEPVPAGPPGASLATFLSVPRDTPGTGFRAGSPLRAAPHASGRTGGSGEDGLPRAALSRSVEPPVEAARAALVDYMRHGFLIIDGAVHIRMPTPVYAPLGTVKVPGTRPEILGGDGYGICFEPQNFPAMVDFLKAIGFRGYHAKAPELPGLFAKDNDFPVAGLGEDLALWLNDGPSLVETVNRRALKLCRLCNYDAPATGPVMESLRPYVDLGLVGAVPPDRFEHVAGLLGDAIDAIRSAIPKSHPQPPLNWLKGYSDVVARPLLCRTEIHAEDADDLMALAPGR